MYMQPEFFGSATVGERGQIVLPAKMRKAFRIKAGDKLLVLGNAQMGGVILMKGDVLGNVLNQVNRNIQEFHKKIKESK
jgi:AbrB family looped-hinge helix DNA binding protein